MAAPPGETYLMYVDDSGDQTQTVYSALLVPVSAWTEHLERWLSLRQWLYKKYELPARFELHAYSWIPLKGEPVVPDRPELLINTSVGLRREIAERALFVVSQMAGLGVVTCVGAGADHVPVYEQLLATVDAELAARRSWALSIVDGDPTNPDPHVQRAHRKLDIRRRRIVEDGWLQPAHMSQLIQMADLVAHSAFQAHRRRPERQFMWGWYAKHIHDREWVCRCPTV